MIITFSKDPNYVCSISINIAQIEGKTKTLLKEAFIGSKNNKS